MTIDSDDWSSWRDVVSQKELIEELRASIEKGTRNVDSIRRSLVLDIFSHIRPLIRASGSQIDGIAENSTSQTTSTDKLPPFSDATFVKRLRKWIWILGWCVQSHAEESASDATSRDVTDSATTSTKKGPIISMAKAWQCIEECFEGLPLSDAATWFEWLISEDWMQSGSEVKVPASELGVPLRFFRSLLLRVSYAASNARSAVAQPHRLANLTGLILSYASSILPLCHASGLNRKSLINSSRKTPVIVSDTDEFCVKILQSDQKATEEKPTGRNGRRGNDKSGASTPRNSIFESAQTFLKASQIASNPLKPPQQQGGKQQQRGGREAQRPVAPLLSKANYDLLWEFVAKLSVLAGKFNDPKDSLRIDSNLNDFDAQLQKVLPVIVSYEASDKASSVSTTTASESTPAVLESSRSTLTSISSSGYAPNSVASFLAPTSLQSSTFLTLPFATHLQLLQPGFRLQLIVHILIFLHSLKKPSAAPVAGAKVVTEKALTTEGTNTLNAIIKRVESALSAVLQKTLVCPTSDSSDTRTPASSNTAFLMCQAVLSYMESEAKYVEWKVANCPDFELPLPVSLAFTNTESAMDVDLAASHGSTASKKRKSAFWSTPAAGEPVPPGVLQSTALTTQNVSMLDSSLQEFITANKKRKEAQLRDGFVGCPPRSATAKGPRFNLGAPALSELFNRAATESSGMPSLDDALGDIPTHASTWRARRVVLYRGNISAYNALCTTSNNSEGEPFDLASFASASNRNFPAHLFVPPAPPTPPPAPEPIVEAAEESAAQELVPEEGKDSNAMQLSEPTSAAPSSPNGEDQQVKGENDGAEAKEGNTEEQAQEEDQAAADDDGLGDLFIEE